AQAAVSARGRLEHRSGRHVRRRRRVLGRPRVPALRRERLGRYRFRGLPMERRQPGRPPMGHAADRAPAAALARILSMATRGPFTEFDWAGVTLYDVARVARLFVLAALARGTAKPPHAP